MTERYRMTASRAELRLNFAVASIPEAERRPGRELVPRRPAYIVRNFGGRILDVMSWGIPVQGSNRIVAATGSLLHAGWREAAQRPDRRCLIPATGYAEMLPGHTPRDPRLQWIGIPARPIFAFAGLWQERVLEGPVFAILNADPNRLTTEIGRPHMPIILREKDYDQWLTGSFDEVRMLAQPYPSDLMALAANDPPQIGDPPQ